MLYNLSNTIFLTSLNSLLAKCIQVHKYNEVYSEVSASELKEYLEEMHPRY